MKNAFKRNIRDQNVVGYLVSFRVADYYIGNVKVPCRWLIKFCQINTDQDLLPYMSAINVSTAYNVIIASMIERDLLEKQKLFCIPITTYLQLQEDG